MLDLAIPPSTLILRSCVSGVSKDVPVRSGNIWSILRDAPAALLRMRAVGWNSEHQNA
jgi:hypothetical protein